MSSDIVTNDITDKNLGLWGGLIETMFSQYTFPEIEALKEGKKFLEWKERLNSIEKSKNIKEIRRLISLFSENERNYINSPLLDQLSLTAKCRHPMRKALKKNYREAVKFYTQRDIYSFLFIEYINTFGYKVKKKLKISIENNTVKIYEFMFIPLYYFKNRKLNDEGRSHYQKTFYVFLGYYQNVISALLG